MRQAALIGVTAVLLFAGSSTALGASPPAPAIRISFSGTATGRLVDVERWVLLSSNECYLRRTRDQATTLTWRVTFAGGRSLSVAAAPSVAGTVSGTETQDSCDDVAEELPPEAPPDWLHDITCSDPLGILRPGRATWVGGVLRIRAPVVAVAKSAACTALPRSDELNARIVLPAGRITRLKRGARITIPVGSARPATGTYRPRANCLHPAKPYDGYRSNDTCVDTLRWSGTVTITRL